QRKWAAILSISLFLLSIASLAMYGLNWGLDFTGGTQIQLSYPQEANLDEIRDNLAKAGFPETVVINYGNSKDVLVSVLPKDKNGAQLDEKAQAQMIKEILSALPGATVDQVNYIGPQVGKESTFKGVIAVIVALLGTMVYIAFRFDLRFSIGSTVALVHDP